MCLLNPRADLERGKKSKESLLLRPSPPPLVDLLLLFLVVWCFHCAIYGGEDLQGEGGRGREADVRGGLYLFHLLYSKLVDMMEYVCMCTQAWSIWKKSSRTRLWNWLRPPLRSTHKPIGTVTWLVNPWEKYMVAYAQGPQCKLNSCSRS
jgi:hypothetical protein